ncbi:MAG TPA: serine hydrolase domain-containing protein, partial [Verrucomicrobiota bacterium]|nr:serine hydrolase domain-containing protein [Verrucomicrobiota bacterium]
MRLPILFVLVLGLVLGGVHAGPPLRPGQLPALEAALASAIAAGKTPGGVLWLERDGEVHRLALGRRAVAPAPEPMTADTVFDAASLTKVVATTPAVLRLVALDRVRLDAPVRTYLPEFTGEGREEVTVTHLLTHTSGLRAGIPLRPEWSGYDAGLALALAEMPTAPPGTQFRYSDVNFILLGELVRRVSGRGLDEFCAAELFGPLGMRDTRFNPPAGLRPRIAPTTLVGGEYLRGVVHDPTARRLGGVAGHAGLFTTAADLARFCRMLLDEGALDGVRVLDPLLVRLMVSVQTPPGLTAARRGLGWGIDSPYAGPRGELFPVGSYGHTGWTGTSLWVDPFSRTFVIFLANRNHPTEDGNVLALRRQLGTLAARAVADFDFANVPGALPRQAAAVTAAADG